MSVEKLKSVHDDYVQTSDRFRAAWAFFQFLQSVQKIFLPEQYAKGGTEFQELYARLKALSQSLNASETDRVEGELAQIQKQLEKLTARQLAEDSKVDPQFLRQFFQRVKSYDTKILTQLVKFYLYSVDVGGWDPDRIDKADFLMSRLAVEEVDGEGRTRLKSRADLNEILAGLWRVLDRAPLADSLVEAHCRAVQELRQEVKNVANLDDLSDLHLIARYRDLKHALGDLFFYPRLTQEILETNVALQNTVNRLFNQEEQRIIADYQRIFELERDAAVDQALDQELVQFRQAVERFEKQLEGKNVDLKDLAAIRERVRTLLPQLSDSTRDAGFVEAHQDTVEQSTVAPLRDDSSPGQRDLLTARMRIAHVMESVNPSLSSKQLAVSREIYPFRLEPREVTAYRRAESDPKCDRALEQFLFDSAVLRVLLNESAEEIKGVLDETAVTGESPAFNRARHLTELADSHLRQFDHLVNRCLLTEDPAEAQTLEVCRMRLMRDFSGLWLLVYRRFLVR
jgi:hypothetical protein